MCKYKGHKGGSLITTLSTIYEGGVFNAAPWQPPLTNNHKVELKASFERLLPNLFLNGIEPDIAVQFGSQVAPASGLRHDIGHQLEEFSK